MYKVLLKKTKYQFIPEIRKAGLLIVFALLSGLVYAQSEDQPIVDSTATYQEESIITEEVPVEDGSYSSPSIETDNADNYFDYKWEHEGSWDSLYSRKLPDREVAKLRDDDDYWYANYNFPKPEENKNNTTRKKSWSLTLYDSVLWFITIVGFIGFLVIYLLNSNVRMFRGSKDVHIGDEDGDVDYDDIFSINYDKEIQKAINAGNQRLAVRLLFLRLLRRLADKNIIQYKHDRTNFDYLMQLGNTKWYDPFRFLARHYEYVWYGKFEIDDRQFNILRNEFDNLEKQL